MTQPVDRPSGLPASSVPDTSVLGVAGTRDGVFGVDGLSSEVSGFGGMHQAIMLPEASQPPYGGWFDLVARQIRTVAPQAILQVVVYRGEVTFYIDRTQLTELVKHLRDDEGLRFEALMSVHGVHYPAQVGSEFHVIYELMSMTHNRRIRLETMCPASDPHVPSVVATYPMANYDEREVWDMFGVIFDGHPGLTRILMPDDWVGHPLRKDYPLGGVPLEFKGAVVPPVDQRENKAR
ncbi:MAG: NADH-quinone oxidoreductase subunit C [Propionibacteriaceae bacterium]|nr:NADH-quinone oxidoreductase subunit C [Propionibacteriaceae bacterium]